MVTALSTAETALRRMPDDPAVPVTLTGAEAVAVVAELDRLRRVLADVEELARDAIDERDRGTRNAGKLQGHELHEMDGAAALAEATLGVLGSEAQPVVDDLHEVVMHDVVWQRLCAWFDSVGLETYPIPVRGPIPAHGVRAKDLQPRGRDTMPDHDAQVMPFADVTDRWVLRCGCGLLAEYATRDEAEQARDDHLTDGAPT